MSRSKLRDQRYGVQPKNVELKQEELPQSPAKKTRGYCKKLKGEHIFELVDVTIWPHHCYPERNRECFVSGLTRFKEYRCTGCNKKDLVHEEVKFEQLVRKEELSILR